MDINISQIPQINTPSIGQIAWSPPAVIQATIPSGERLTSEAQGELRQAVQLLPLSKDPALEKARTLHEQMEEALENSPEYLLVKLLLEDGDEEKSDIEKANRSMSKAIQRAHGVPSESENASASATAGDMRGALSIEGSSGRVRVEVVESRTVRAASTIITYNGVTYTRQSISVEVEVEIQQSDPLVLDLDGDGIETTGVRQGAKFDINGDGEQERVSFVAGGDAFLALDGNQNGRIDSGKELFGDQNGDANGFEALSRYDENVDGRIDSADTVFNNLRLLDLNRDGSQRLRTLAESGVRSISLAYREGDEKLNAYDTLVQAGSFETIDASNGRAADLMLGWMSGIKGR